MLPDCIPYPNARACSIFVFSLGNSTNAGNVLCKRSRRADRDCPIALALGINLVSDHIPSRLPKTHRVATPLLINPS